MIKDILQMEEDLLRQMEELKGDERPSARLRRRQLESDRKELLATCTNLTAEDKVFLARHPKRPKIDEYINALFTDFFEQKGDRANSDDTSILGGIAMYQGMPVTVIGHRKGNTLEENMAYNFGMPEPEGYRKALRMMEQAEKFGRPIITFIDTPGAYPGKEAEEHGQGEAIARNLMVMSGLQVPVIAVVTGYTYIYSAAALWRWALPTGSSCWKTRSTRCCPPKGLPVSCGKMPPAGPKPAKS